MNNVDHIQSSKRAGHSKGRHLRRKWGTRECTREPDWLAGGKCQSLIKIDTRTQIEGVRLTGKSCWDKCQNLVTALLRAKKIYVTTIWILCEYLTCLELFGLFLSSLLAKAIECVCDFCWADLLCYCFALFTFLKCCLVQCWDRCKLCNKHKPSVINCL